MSVQLNVIGGVGHQILVSALSSQVSTLDMVYHFEMLLKFGFEALLQRIGRNLLYY